MLVLTQAKTCLGCGHRLHGVCRVRIRSFAGNSGWQHSVELRCLGSTAAVWVAQPHLKHQKEYICRLYPAWVNRESISRHK